MKRGITISLGLAMFAAAAGPALGWDACVFDPKSGDTGLWSDEDNWDNCSGQSPYTGDSARIKDGQTCKIETDHEFADRILVDSGAVLHIKVVSLTLEGCANSIVNGTVSFETLSSSTPAYMRFVNDQTIFGSGTFTGGTTVDDRFYAFGGAATCLPNDCATLTITSGITVTGFMYVVEIDLVNNGTFESTSGVQGIEIFPSDEANLSGGGDFKVSAGKMEVHNATFNGTPPYLEWYVSGGTMTIETGCGDCDDINGKLIISGGELHVDQDLCTERDLDWTGGKIIVASGKDARFSADPCP